MKSSPLKLLVGVGAAIGGLPPSPSWAQSAASPELVVTGSCPEASAVGTLLSTLVPRAASAGRAPAPAIVIADRDTEFLVAVGSRSKIYADPARDCAQRARIAAAFIALALLPDIEPPAPEAPASRPQPPPPVAPPAETRRDWGSIDARAALAVGLPAEVAAPGILVRAAAGRDAFGGHVACGWFFGTSTPLAGESGSVLLERLPCDAGATARWFWPGRRLQSAVDVGFAVGLLRVMGRGFASTYASSHVELGARLAADTALRLTEGRQALMPIVGLEVTAYATSYDFDVAPHGIVGHAPAVWGAVTAGLQWGSEVGP